MTAGADEPVPSKRAASAPGEGINDRTRRSYRADDWLWLAAVYLAFFALFEAKLHRPGVIFGGDANAQIAEAQAWWQGRLDLPTRWLDTAELEGRYYSHFPVLFTLLAAGVVPFYDGVPHWFMAALVLPLPLLCFELCRRASASSRWGALLGFGLLCGTSLWPVMKKVVISAAPYHVNHLLATIAVLVLLIEWAGRRRIWACAGALLAATLARQLTVGLLAPLIWLAWRQWSRERGGAGMAVAGAFALVTIAAPLTMNALKFGSPFASGYRLIYEGRDEGDLFARDARTHGLFSAHFLARNLYYMNLGPPDFYRIEVEGIKQGLLKPNQMGTGIWWTTPALLFLLVGFRRILLDPSRRVLLGGALLTIAALMLFHATGAYQRGYNRFSLDYLPVLYALAIPTAIAKGWRWLTPVLVAWSVLYFRILVQWSYWRLW